MHQARVREGLDSLPFVPLLSKQLYKSLYKTIISNFTRHLQVTLHGTVLQFSGQFTSELQEILQVNLLSYISTSHDVKFYRKKHKLVYKEVVGF